MDIAFLITTYNRQESCQRLVDALQGQGDIVVVNDGCDYDINGCTQYKQKLHHAKMFYWRTVNNLFQLKGGHKYYIMLPDDFLPVENFAERAIEIWEGIQDEKKICLNLINDRIGVRCWTNFDPIKKGDIWQTGWVDMCFLCEISFFNHLGTLNINHVRTSRNRSSGVGMYISRQLLKKGFHFYQVEEQLVVPQEEHYKSKMHNENNCWDRLPHGTQGTFIKDTRLLRGSGR